MIWNFNDFKSAKPQKPGTYEWWSKETGMRVDIKWDGDRWRFMNGDLIPKGIVRWWR